MADGKLSYEITGDSSSLASAFRGAQQSHDGLLKTLGPAITRLSVWAAAAKFAYDAAVKFQQATTATWREVERFSQVAAGASFTQLEGDFRRAAEGLKELKREAEDLTPWQKLKAATFNLMTGMDHQAEKERAARHAAISAIQGQNQQLAQQLEVINLRNSGDEKGAALLEAQQKWQREIAAAKEKAAAIKDDDLGMRQLDKQIALLEKKRDAELESIRARFEGEKSVAASASEALPIHQEATDLSAMFAESQSAASGSMLEQAGSAASVASDLGAQWENLSRTTRAQVERAIQEEAIAQRVKAQADQYEAAKTPAQKIQEASAAISSSLPNAVTPASNLEGHFKGARDALAEMQKNMPTLASAFSSVGQTIQRDLNLKLDATKISVGDVILKQKDWTAEVGRTKAAYDEMDRMLIQRMGVTLANILTKVSQIATEARAAGSAVAVLG